MYGCMGVLVIVCFCWLLLDEPKRRRPLCIVAYMRGCCVSVYWCMDVWEYIGCCLLLLFIFCCVVLLGYSHTSKHPYIHAPIHPYTHTHIHTYTHTHINNKNTQQPIPPYTHTQTHNNHAYRPLYTEVFVAWVYSTTQTHNKK